MTTPTPAPAFKKAPLSISKLCLYLQSAMVRKIKYLMGAKPDQLHLAALPPTYKEADCSGFMQGLLAYGSAGKMIVPEGSATQYAWFTENGYESCDPSECENHDGGLRICFHIADEEDETGHVWLVWGRPKSEPITLECYAGQGPGHRAWNALLSHVYRGHRLKLNQLCTHCFRLL